MINLNWEVSTLDASNCLKCSFNDALAEAIDEAFASLGVSCRQATYHILEKTFKIDKNEIPSKIEEFASAIEAILGVGAKLIEIDIMKRLYRKLDGFRYLPNEGSLTFTEYVAAAKKHAQKTS